MSSLQNAKSKGEAISHLYVLSKSLLAFDRVASICAEYSNAEVIWAQQEPKNMGAYSYISPRVETATRQINGDEKRPRYVGRPVSAAPATGMGKVHQKEFQDIMDGVFGNIE
eukprot:726647_1